MFMVNLIFAALGLGGGYLAANFFIGPADALKCASSSSSLLPLFPDPCLTIFGAHPASPAAINSVAFIFALLAFGGANMIEWVIAQRKPKN